MNDRMHPQDLRAMMAAHIYGQGLQLIAGAQWQNVNDYRQTVADVDALLAELESTEKPQHQGPFGEVVPRDRVDAIVRRADGAEAERDALREKLDDCLESLRLIERVTRPDGDMADAAVNLLIRSCRWHAYKAHGCAPQGEVQL